MKNEKFYTVHSYYDKDGQKSRFAESVEGEVFLYQGYRFGLYLDPKDGLWKLIDVMTGKQLASSEKKEFTRSRIAVPGVFYDYVTRTKTEDYANLVKELQDLIAMEVLAHEAM